MENNQYLLHSNLTVYRKIQSQGTFTPWLQRRPADTPGSFFQEPLARVISDAVDRTIEAGASVFRREIMLPRLLPVGTEEIADHSAAGRWRIVRRLARALRGERTRGRAGHWTYSLNRHIGLLQAFKAERAALRQILPPRSMHDTVVNGSGGLNPPHRTPKSRPELNPDGF